MIEVPSEKESVRLFIKNLQEKYSKHIKYQNNLRTFKAVYDIGINIEDGLAKLKATTITLIVDGKARRTKILLLPKLPTLTMLALLT